MAEAEAGNTTGKRYYWLKLQDGFFTSKRIKKLRKLAGGDTYTIIYLKMQLLAMKSDGILRWTGLENDFATELALDLDEEPDNVEVTLRFLLAHGLAETSDNIHFFLPYAVENVGSEGSSAKRVREYRKRQQLQCNAAALQSDAGVTGVKRLCNGEKEIEIELDREKEKEPISSISGSTGKRECEGENPQRSDFPQASVDNPVEKQELSQQEAEQAFEAKREAALAKLINNT